MFKSTREVAELLGVAPGRIGRAVWEGRLAPPVKSPSGAFLWREENIRRASWVLLRKHLDDVLAGRTEGKEAGE